MTNQLQQYSQAVDVSKDHVYMEVLVCSIAHIKQIKVWAKNSAASMQQWEHNPTQ